MTLSSVRATFGLNCKATPASPGASGTVSLGAANETISITATKMITFEAAICSAGSSLVLDVSDLDGTGTTSFTAGNAQVETGTVVAASGITGDGNAQIIITCTGMTGSPKTINVPVTTTAHTTAALIAAALRTAAAADSAVSALLTIGGTGADITATVKPLDTYTVNGTSTPIYDANITNLNIAIQNGTCTGITTAATSTNTTAGVATTGVYAPKLTGQDFEGLATGGLTEIDAIYIKNDVISVSAAAISNGATLVAYPLATGDGFMIGGESGLIPLQDHTITTTGRCLVTVTIAGS